ncbi:fluoride efflux transporter CrcB [Cereibacter sphaeroides]|uniref:fluoride efflux transporter CrcB n=1 Tax=Cereibacter sphaeroides TaxID=1063 RepID=UPI001F35B3F3|nr:fluoride efflux transporter CrcB [Cereibacter sphaeroides]MCE6950438.1 fluoride efflux transporter CrcB [Cereibacter sphaeroides]MCE6959529.1 fluoride efflux transporter CrcB [Cereibacter sphaeroides]MCE6968198.1 fluoride efflux transporter CrcB [Cereibacter sphaeroides]MCE6971556.1 fluoride efflux transporter CrcB [Cereibacter sphaeroides]
MISSLLQVALGGALGASARYLTNIASMRLFGSGFPIGTVFVNVLGSFLMGVLVVVLAHKGGNRWAPFLMTGILGGFTTFSAFSLDAATLYERGELGLAAVYVVVTVSLSLVALFAGMAAMRGVFA